MFDCYLIEKTMRQMFWIISIKWHGIGVINFDFIYGIDLHFQNHTWKIEILARYKPFLLKTKAILRQGDKWVHANLPDTSVLSTGHIHVNCTIQLQMFQCLCATIYEILAVELYKTLNVDN